MLENKVLGKPIILNLNGTVQNGDVVFQIDRDIAAVPYPDEPVTYTVKLKMLQSLTGQMGTGDWEILSESGDYYHRYRMKERENGMYVISVLASQEKEGDVVTSDSAEANFVLMNTGEPVIHPLNTVEFETHVRNNIEMTPGMNEYFEHIVFDRPNNMSMNGLFLQYEVKEDSTSLYHQTEVMVERNGQLLPDVYSFVFEDVEEDIAEDAIDLLRGTGSTVGRLQKAGAKTGILFIPIEIRDTDQIKIRMKISEYAEIDFRTLLDVSDLTLGLEDFKAFYYVAFATEKPQIIIGDLKGPRPTGGEIEIIYNNTNFFTQTALVKLIREEENEGDVSYETAQQRKFPFLFDEEGTFRIICAVVGVPAEEFDWQNPEKALITKVEKEFTIYPPCDIQVKHDKVIEKGKDLTVEISSALPADPKRCYISIRKYEPEMSLDVTKTEDGRFLSKASFPTADLPNGLHVIIVKYLLNDGTTEVKSSTFLVREDDNFDITYFN